MTCRGTRAILLNTSSSLCLAPATSRQWRRLSMRHTPTWHFHRDRLSIPASRLLHNTWTTTGMAANARGALGSSSGGADGTVVFTVAYGPSNAHRIWPPAYHETSWRFSTTIFAAKSLDPAIRLHTGIFAQFAIGWGTRESPPSSSLRPLPSSTSAIIPICLFIASFTLNTE